MSSQISAGDMYPTFDEFVLQFDKVYADAAETRYRRSVYEANVEKIAAHNARSTSYHMAVNAFADLTQPEFRVKHLGTVAARSGALLGASQRFYLGRQVYSGADLPDVVDWTNSTTPVKNQGHCGSCYAFSATGAMEGREFLHRKAKGDPNTQLLDLAEQQIVDCTEYTGNQGCNGGLMDFVFDYVKANGICAEEDYPYHADEGQCKAEACKPVIKPGALSGYIDVAPRDAEALMEALTEGPVAVAIEADDQAFQFYHSGVLTAECGDNLNHGVLAVGYGVTTDGQKFWKIKNSWGTAWGDHGYILIDRDTVGNGKCGILMAASYPVLEGDKVLVIRGGKTLKIGADSAQATPVENLIEGAEPYGPPPCQGDDRQVALQEAPGYSFCAPPCGAQDACPAATGAKSARPMCALQDPMSTNHYCALLCKAGNGGCQPGAECVKVQGSIGVCMFKDKRSAAGLATDLVWASADNDDDEVFVFEMIE
jgi:C1A family cysteine protease